MARKYVLIEYPESELLLKYKWINKCVKCASMTPGKYDYMVPLCFYNIYEADYKNDAK